MKENEIKPYKSVSKKTRKRNKKILYVFFLFRPFFSFSFLKKLIVNKTKEFFETLK